MPATRINLTADAKTIVARADVPARAVFAYVDKNGDRMEGRYAAIGNSTKDDRLFSVNLKNGELASGRAKDATRKVEVIGAFTYNATINPDKTAHVARKRSEVKSGEVFIVPNAKRGDGAKPVLYAHMGLVNDGRYLSVDLNTLELASTTNGNSNVIVVGTFAVDATVTK